MALLLSLIFLFQLSLSQDLQSPQKLSLDFNLDGIEDLVQGVHSDSFYTITFISLDTVSIKIPLGNSMNQDAFCGTEIELTKENLDYDLKEIFEDDIPGFKRSKSDFGVRLSDGMCDSFHFFWNHKLKQMQYWRL